MKKALFIVISSMAAGLLAFAQVYKKDQLVVGEIYHIKSANVNLRADTSLSSESVIGKLNTNDQVRVLDILDDNTPLVKIEIIKSKMMIEGNTYVAADYLQKLPVGSVAESQQLSKYIVVQNVATERTRIYERCTLTPNCAHRLIMETEMVIGRSEGPKEDKARFLTWLGRFKITDWKKFYQDGEVHYPSWYDPSYPPVPKPGSSASSWLSKKILPNKETGSMRGAFGWYAAMVGPNANSQWIHGTLGWGADGDKFIDYTRSSWVNMFANPRSSGCTRIENRAVAYMRSTLPVGTEVVRVYAKEALRDVTLANYEAQKTPAVWEYILTTEAVRKSNPPGSDKNSVLNRLSQNKITSSDILEEGTYEVDQYPTGLGLMLNADSFAREKAISGNPYKINDNDFRGVFLIDEGRFINYEHPMGLTVGGYQNRELPDYLRTYGAYTDAKPVRKSKNDKSTNGPRR